jgi:hypothetical protein
MEAYHTVITSPGQPFFVGVTSGNSAVYFSQGAFSVTTGSFTLKSFEGTAASSSNHLFITGFWYSYQKVRVTKVVSNTASTHIDLTGDDFTDLTRVTLSTNNGLQGIIDDLVIVML